MTTKLAHPQPEPLTHPKYRPDIDGLRAIAVLSVVIYHAFPGLIGGGFIGVDIFFVISGFLISTIIMESLEQNRFSFFEFYSRRIKRIFPALLLVLISSFVFGWFTLLADEYKQLGKHIAGGAGFISNFLFWSESGYFDNSAETKPLLHLWSLGIEEQFYIVWPLLLWLAWKKRFNMLTITMAIAVISFILNISLVHSDAVATFYSPQTRFWELLMGSTLAYVTLHKRNIFPRVSHRLDIWPVQFIYIQTLKINSKTLHNIPSVIGATLILTSLLVITKERNFPGWWAVLPTIGTVMIISAGMQSWFNRVVLSNRILVWFGLISFPLYLWHWPLLSFTRIIESESPSNQTRVSVLLISVALAWLTYKFIEKPIRFGKFTKTKTLLLIMLAIGYGGYKTYQEDGWKLRTIQTISDVYIKTIRVPEKTKECFEIPYAYKKDSEWFCHIGHEGIKPNYFAYGDSHVLNLLPALEKFSIEHQESILMTGTSGCPSLIGIQSIRGIANIEKFNCMKLNDRVYDYVKTHQIKNVILANRWTYYTSSHSRPSEWNAVARFPDKPVTKETSTNDLKWAIQNTIKKYNDIGVKVIMVEDNPQQVFDPKDALRKAASKNDLAINKHSVSLQEHLKNQLLINKFIEAQGVQILNFDSVLCADMNCKLVKNGKFLYSDDDHLSVDGSLTIYPSLLNLLTSKRAVLNEAF